ncbi:hypothetical protein [Pseudonocardia sp.]|uniref:hypothetical protein n=1 Tax=Pseudonocardia sp. TaxID=60912 RepID=UPI003D14A980
MADAPAMRQFPGYGPASRRDGWGGDDGPAREVPRGRPHRSGDVVRPALRVAIR